MRYDTIQEIDKSDRYDEIVEVAKFNPYHGADGRFSTADGATSFTYKPGQGAMYDNAIARERERQANSAAGAAKIKESEDKLRGMLRDGATVKLEGMDPDMAEATVSAVSSVLDRYPTTKDAFKGFTTDDCRGTFEKEDGVMGMNDPLTNIIHLNTKYYGDREKTSKLYEESVEKQFHPKGTTFDSVVVHEMGHALDHYLSKQTIPRENYYWKQERVSSRIWNNAIKNGKKAGTPLTGKSITEGLSRYASKNSKEYLAEGFAEYMTSSSPRPTAVKIGKNIETYIKKAAKKAEA